MSFLVPFTLAFAWPAGVAAAISLPFRRRDQFAVTWASVASGGAVLDCAFTLASGQGWPVTAGAFTSAAVALLLWRRGNRRRKRAPKALGAKSRAALAALVRRMRESAAPRGALRPAPQGAA